MHKTRFKVELSEHIKTYMYSGLLAAAMACLGYVAKQLPHTMHPAARAKVGSPNFSKTKSNGFQTYPSAVVRRQFAFIGRRSFSFLAPNAYVRTLLDDS
jgi:hypothetical protein